MYLIGRLLVERIVSQAQVLLPYDVWDVPEKIFACRRSITIISIRRKVTIEIAKGLRFPLRIGRKGRIGFYPHLIQPNFARRAAVRRCIGEAARPAD